MPQLEDVSREGETEALRAVVEALASERDDLLRERLETQREALGLDVEGVSLPPTPPEGSEGSADSIEEMFWGPQRRERAASPRTRTGNDDKDPEEEDDFTFTERALGAALAVASLVLVVSVARAAKPVLARRAALVGGGGGRRRALTRVLRRHSRPARCPLLYRRDTSNVNDGALLDHPMFQRDPLMVVMSRADIRT